ncbi:oryzain alpha chain-like, partial [Trifolium medium]|nr:oryzain alpha chain-like [Trifolium medium]
VVVTLAVDGPHFDQYTGGVYSHEPGFYDKNTALHGMLLVGYGKHGEDCWILQNSYGTDFGDEGFMYLKRGTGKALGCCSILVSPTYPKV